MASGEAALLLTGLPKDATEREVHILFSACPGLLRCSIYDSPRAAARWGLAHFTSRSDADAALSARRGSTWGPSLPCINLQLARLGADAPAPLAHTGIEDDPWLEPWPPAHAQFVGTAAHEFDGARRERELQADAGGIHPPDRYLSFSPGAELALLPPPVPGQQSAAELRIG